MKLVIIEDEPLMLDALEEEILRIEPSTEIVGRFGSVSTAQDFFIKNGACDLIFSDIQLSDGLSFEIFEAIDLKTPVIFCTAYDHYALEAFRSNGIDYILKPFDAQDIEKTLMKYKQLTGVEKPEGIWQKVVEELKHIETNSRKQTSILVRKGDQIIPVNCEDIALAHFEHGNNHIWLFDGQKYVVSYNLDSLLEILGKSYYRLNRQCLIKREAVKNVEHYFARKLRVTPVISMSEDLLVSKANATSFLSWLEFN